jgi:hypothetical protein
MIAELILDKKSEEEKKFPYPQMAPVDIHRLIHRAKVLF